MTADDRQCPTRDVLELFVSTGVADELLTRHLDQCLACKRSVREIQADNVLLAEFAVANKDAFGSNDARSPVVSIAGYEIQEEMHSGAQGVVFKALQTATKRTVAVKVLHRGAFITAKQRYRFDREVELVASLRHPNVVTVYDSGRTRDGGHFLAMEYIEGRTLDEIIGDAASSVLSDHGKDLTIAMIRSISDAVAAAHRRGIIHRDLKPANILVDEAGQPHILDFGIARQEGEFDDQSTTRTIVGEFVGTFAYAAPEQVKGDPDAVDVRTDVYALGVILYELLTGRRPYELRGSTADVVETILRTEAASPSTRNDFVDGDLDAITLKCLEKEQDKRYQSASALVDDLDRFARGEAIEARPHSEWYVIRKFIKRHKVATGVAASYAMLITVFAVIVSILLFQVYWERDRLKQDQAVLKQLIATAADPLRGGSATVNAVDLMVQLAAAIEANLSEHRDLAAGIRNSIGIVFLEHAQFDDARRELDTALQHRLAAFGEDSVEVAETLHNMARVHWSLDEFEAARHKYERALDIRERKLGPNDSMTIESRKHLAGTLMRLGDYKSSETLHKQVLTKLIELRGSDNAEVAAVQNNLAVLQNDLGRYEEALENFKNAVAAISRIESSDSLKVARGKHNIGLCLIGLGRFDEAIHIINEAIELKSERLDDQHPAVAYSRTYLARAQYFSGHTEDARINAQAALTAQRASYPDSHTETALTLTILGAIAIDEGDYSKAVALLRESFDMRRQLLPPGHVDTAETKSLLGDALSRSGDADTAHTFLRTSERTIRAFHGVDHYQAHTAAERLRAHELRFPTSGHQ